MAAVSFGLRLGRFVDPFRPVSRRMRAPYSGPAGRAVVAAMRRSVRREFIQGGQTTRTGGVVRWKRGHNFGRWRPASTPLGGAGSRYLAAFEGGKGGTMRITGRTASIGSTLPGAAAHRGGTGFRAQPNKLTRIRGGESMRQALGHKHGAWITRQTAERGLKLYSRPHAGTNPALELETAEITQRYLVTGRAA